jgi:diguanylate cyclase (GGDEF)-like protein
LEEGLDRHARSWLCPEPEDRERLIDMDARLGKARTLAMVVLGVGLLAAGPWVGWWTVFVLIGVFLAWRLLDGAKSRTRKPEWLIASGWLVSVMAIAAGILLTGAANSPAKSWLVVPALSLPARFRTNGIIAGVAICLVVLAAVTIGAEPGEVIDAPQLFLFPAALIAAAIAISMALHEAEIEHRSQAVLDQLTGMLNRKALETRTVELELQSRISGQPVGLIVCDIDRFKSVNDDHGHARGDAVLRDFAYRIRKQLRAYDLAYRLGGEEFVVLLPGAGLDQTREMAERLRAATEADPCAGVEMTASFGVAVSGPSGLDFEDLFKRADDALYRAKEAGRNRVAAVDDTAVAAIT